MCGSVERGMCVGLIVGLYLFDDDGKHDIVRSRGRAGVLSG